MPLIDSHDVTYPGRVWSVEAVRRQHGHDAELADPSQNEGGKGRISALRAAAAFRWAAPRVATNRVCTMCTARASDSIVPCSE